MLPKNSVLLLVSNLMIVVKVSGDISEFRLHELDEYNEMIGCLSTFKDDFVTCNQHIKNLGHTVYNLFPENSTLGKAIKCCGIWMVRSDLYLFTITYHYMLLYIFCHLMSDSAVFLVFYRFIICWARNPKRLLAESISKVASSSSTLQKETNLCQKFK